MDILAIVTFDHLLEGYRISFKAQRFFQIEEAQSIEALCFSPDCTKHPTQHNSSPIAYSTVP
jgi:hypothetical protein